MAMSNKKSSSSSRTVSAESSTNPLPDMQPRLRRSRVQNNRAERARNKATSSLRRPLAISDHNQEDHMYACSLCPEKFTTYQALGGHQNAHRRERLLQRCLMMMEAQEQMAENDIKVIHDHQNPSNSASSNIVYSPNPIRVAYPLTEFQRVGFPPHHQPSLGLKMGPNPTFDGPSPTWLTHLLHRPPPPPPPPSPAPSPSPAAPLVAGYGPPPSPRGWVPHHHPYLGMAAQLPRPVMHDFLAHGRAEPSFPPGFGVHYEHGSGSAAAMIIDNKGKAVVEEEGKKSWGRDLKLWP